MPIRHHPAAWPAASSITLAALAWLGAACGGGGNNGPPPPPYVEPKFTPVACPAPTLVSGGLNPAVDPGPTCVVGAPRPSSLPDSAGGTLQGWSDLGPHTVGEVVNVVVPAGTASLLLMEQWLSGGTPGQVLQVSIAGSPLQAQENVAVIGELHDPSGKLVYTDLVVITGSDLSNALVYAQGSGAVVGSVSYPSTSAGLQAIGTGGVAGGTWTVMVNDYRYECFLAAQPAGVRPPGLASVSCDAASQGNDGRYQLFALTTAAAAPGGDSAIRATATLDMAFHIVDAPTPIIKVDSAHAPTDPGMLRMIESYGALMAGAGVCLGTVTFYDEPDWARARFATGISADDATPCGNLPQLLATSTPGQGTLELFLVPSMKGTSTGSSSVIGVDGTIPGPATVNGTVASGAVVSAENFGHGICPALGQPIKPFSCGYDVTAYVAAHESGHFLGLYHVSEGAGDLFDPVTDTPHCECSARCGLTAAVCNAGLAPSRCVRADVKCSGGDNLMFWELGPESQGFLSPEQARLVRSSPVLR
jgi:hypothetical protein